MSLSAEAAATVVQREAIAPILVELAFVTETKRVWSGFGKLKTLDGREWDGVGELGDIGPITPAFSASAPGGKVSVSGVSAEVIARAAVATEYRDRLILFYLQPFQDRAPWGNPVPLGWGFMKFPQISRQAPVRTVAINYEGPYVGRRRPQAAWYSAADQDKRHPGDRYCERVPFYRWKRDDFPHYL